MSEKKRSRSAAVGDSLPVWRDRFGRAHQEKKPGGHGEEPRMQRVRGPLEKAWAHVEQRDDLARAARVEANPRIEPDPENVSGALWTWTVDDADARAVALWTNPVFDYQDVGRAEFTRLDDSTLWTLCLRLPLALRASYRIGIWREDAPPPWRLASGRREVILSARDACAVDARGSARIRTGPGEESSVAAGPDAPAEAWRAGAGGSLAELALSGGNRAWVYRPFVPGSSPVVPGPSPAQASSVPTAPRPASEAEPTPLLALFDGAIWKEMGLPSALDAAIEAGHIPPLHVVLIDSFEGERRYAELGVPSHQVDLLLDEVLPRVRAEWNVDPRGEATLVSGQSLGGLASLWALALSRGEVGHAIAQSASIWRFDLVNALLNESAWRTLYLEAGTFEPDMLADAESLAHKLQNDSRRGDRHIEITAFEAGHDWAVWRTNLLRRLAEILPLPPAAL